MANEKKLPLQSQRLVQDPRGYNVWKRNTVMEELTITRTAILICDMWDKHPSRGALERGAIFAPQIDELLKKARSRGVMIIHSPSDTMSFYEGHPARQRLLDTPSVPLPNPKERPDPPSPVDCSDGGTDTGETDMQWIWTRQTPVIEIDPERDVISDDEGPLVYSFLKSKEITNLIYVGVHTNICVINRTFGIKQMTRWGINCTLVRDLTDTLYNPAMPPYVSHEEGNRLVNEYIEKFWCPTTDRASLMKALD
jgi:nicotinamidase-related amidase